MEVDDLHTVYWVTCGNPAGIPVLFLHGGPGAGISPTSRRFFDSARYHVVLFDQRGAGQSTPLGEYRQNTTELLIDIERLREMLGISQWLVFGGSWGSTLSLAYAQAHPQRCLGLVLRGIWLASAAGNQWWLYGIRNFFPREWEAFAAQVPEAERDDLLAAYWHRLSSDDPAVHTPAAQAWSRYEGSCNSEFKASFHHISRLFVEMAVQRQFGAGLYFPKNQRGLFGVNKAAPEAFYEFSRLNLLQVVSHGSFLGSKDADLPDSSMPEAYFFRQSSIFARL